MKQIMKTLLLAVMMTALSTAMFAQDNSQQRMKREQLAEKQAKHIAHELAFDEQTTAKFTTSFMNYQREVWALGARPQTAKERLDHSQKILNLRNKYYDEYAKFLSDQQIQRVYQLERQQMRRMANHKRGKSRHRIGNNR